MIIDGRDLEDGHRIEADVIVVGGGAAGISLALELSGSGREVVVLESGGTELETRIQELNTGESVGLESPPLASSRLRYLGGTTGHWTGQCGPLDPIDFEVRDWVPWSGWPFGREELDPFYARATRYCELGPMDRFDPTRVREGLGSSPLGLDIDLFEPLSYQTSPPTRFGTVWRTALDEATDVRVYLYANVTGIDLAEGGGAVQGLRCVADGGAELTVRGTNYVLAAGGIENPRVLLASRNVEPQGIGNGRDLVGRFFQNHFNVQGAGSLVFGEPERADLGFQGYWSWEGTSGRGGLRAPDERIRRERLLNSAILLHPVPLNPAFRDEERTAGVDAFVELARSAAGRELPDDAIRQACLAMNGRREVLGFIAQRVRQALGDSGGFLRADLQVEAEPAPNPDSRVTLADDTDRYGVPQARLDWRPSDIDLDSIRRTLSSFGQAVGAAGIGRYQAEFDLAEGEMTLHSTYHHMGTTRMGTDPTVSVVDPQCRIHGVENLFVAGSSVFPTSGRSNPTFTLVALAIRLADHLKTRGTA